MFLLKTPRLILVETPLLALQTRLVNTAAFSAPVNLPDGPAQVTFPAEWPGDALALFPTWLEQMQHAPDELPWGGTLIEPLECVAVGQMGCKNRPQNGSVEIGYGINPAHQKRGYASEMTRALADWLLAQPGVRLVRAECRVDNRGSIRVLEKAGFSVCGERLDPEDGPLFTWERQ